MRPGELRLASMSALFFFLILCGYFLIRPVREAFGVSRGMDQLLWLFGCTSVAALLVVLAFGRTVARMDRRRFIPLAYLFVIGCLLGFAGLLYWDAATGGAIVGSGGETARAAWVRYTFYVWLSVVNLFMTSVFWAFMVDTFDEDQGKRLFAFIGIGGTLGGFAGGQAASWAGRAVESPHLPAGLMLAAAGLFAAAIVVMRTVDRMTAGGGRAREAVLPGDGESSRGSSAGGKSGKGSFWEGVLMVARSRYMLGIGLWITLMAVGNTLLYFTQANVVLENADTLSRRIASFGQLDYVGQLAVLLTQLFVTTHVIRKLGIGWTLAILPLLTLAGFAALALWPAYGVLLIFSAVHRAGRHAVARPSRETLFSVVAPDEKYKAKSVVDVFLYRAGDLAGMGVTGLLGLAGLGVAGMAFGAAPLAAVWIMLSIRLGAARARRAAEPRSAFPSLETPSARAST